MRATDGQNLCSFSQGTGQGGLLARVGVRPVGGRNDRGGVRGVLERIIDPIKGGIFNRAEFAMDGDHGFAETVQLGLDSLSVGSTISVPGTGQLMVGA